LPNSVEHVCLDQAALSLGLVPVPLHVIDNPENLSFVLADSGVALLAVDSAARWQTLAPLQSRLPQLQRVVYLGDEPSSQFARNVADWLAAAAPSEAAEVINASALAAIVYTSGTTGRPKGVMLSHRNVLANVMAIMAAVPVVPSDVFLSFLPLSHSFERTVGYYLPLAAGASVAFARSTSLLMEDMAAIRPTILASVPRIYERVFGKIRESLQSRRMQRALFDTAVWLGWREFQRRQRNGSAASNARLSVLDPWVGAPLRQIFGGRLRAAIAGGAPLASTVARPLLALGVPLLQGYGMTEASPVISCNTPEDNHPESVGRPLPGIEVKLGENDELLVRGPNVMVGYWQRPQDTARTLDPQGWLHTGDQGEIIAARILIKGRIKDIIVTSTGEKIAAVDLETAILGDLAFDQAMVIGEGRPYISALLVLNPQQWRRECAKLGLNATDPASLQSQAALSWALERISNAVQAFPEYAKPRTVCLTTQPWTLDAGLITPTLKPKRAAIEARYAEQIENLYRGHRTVG
jgi:long-chain acyl-CoA synthetase